MGILSKIKKDAPKSEKSTTEKKAASAKKKEPTAPRTNKKDVIASRTLLRPIISEKASDAERQGSYSFEVSLGATKVDVKRAVLEVYGVAPIRVNMMNVQGKTVRRGRVEGKRKDWKKAVVTLPTGKTIHIHEGV